ncbi:MAG: response regulator transcription factor [Fibrobacter sp.]|jgi:two-component system response regulator VicR|nr:response regulator transcription factor [Fibrobacter sp.]HON11290.1 response regulator [Chitinispirillaceae bacterium]
MAKKILVIEDDKDIADLVKLVLETTEDFKVETVLDPLLAYQTAKSYNPDAILLDLSMPKMDGWAVFKVIRSDSSFSGVPIAILTAKSQQFDEMVGLHIMNADAYITKPFGKQELIDKTYELFNKGKK